MKILIHGDHHPGQHAQQQVEAIGALPGVSVVSSMGSRPADNRLLFWIQRVANRFRVPPDLTGENSRLLSLAARERPDAILIQNAKMLYPSTVRALRRNTGVLAYLTLDDIFARGNLSRWLERTFPLWDVFFTTKTFNLPELRARGVRNPVLMNNMFSPELHRPLTRGEVGAEFESFDLVFVGQYEEARARSLARLAGAGCSVLVYGPDAGLVEGGWDKLRGTGVECRSQVWGEAYVRAAHHGKIFLGFLRKKNRDLITTRSVEGPAMARLLLAEKTAEHDAHFVDGVEYVGFTDDDDLVRKARDLIADEPRRHAIAAAGRRRCLESGYDYETLARRIVDALSDARAAGPARRGGE